MSRLARSVTWEHGEGSVRYVASVDGARWELRRDAPHGPYELVVDGAVVDEVAAWPAAWVRPADDDPYQKREMELEEEKLRRTLSIKPSKLV